MEVSHHYKYHKPRTIYNWKNSGLIPKEDESYDSIYDKYIETTHCEKCNVELIRGMKGNNKKCMDHDHKTGYFRNVLCNSCNTKMNGNNTSGVPNVSYDKNRKEWKYQKMVNKERHQKYFKTFEEAVDYKRSYEASLSSSSLTK